MTRCKMKSAITLIHALVAANKQGRESELADHKALSQYRIFLDCFYLQINYAPRDYIGRSGRDLLKWYER